MKRYLIFYLSFFVAAFAEDRGRGRDMNAISEDVDHSLSITLASDLKFRPERGAKNFIITLHAGRYSAFGKDSNGTFFIFDGSGISIPGNFGVAKKGGVYLPSNEAKPVGVWLLPPHYSPKSGVIYLSDLPAEASDAVRKAKP